jgi:STE24 endopeptidase
MLLCAVLLLLVPGTAPGDTVPVARSAAAAASAGPAFDPVAATEAYLARMTPEQRHRSDAYFEGGYWLQLWAFLYGLGVFALLLSSGLSARLRDAAERWVRFRPLQVLIYGAGFILLNTLLLFPLTVYAGYFREHRYGLSNQTFGAWFREELIGLGVGLVLGGLALVALYAVARRAPRTWWLWGAALSVVFVIVAALIAPVFIAPLFNTYSELRQEPLRRSRLRGGRLPPIQTDQRQRQRSRRNAAHLSQRQPAEPHVAGNRRGGHGPRDGALCPQPHL